MLKLTMLLLAIVFWGDSVMAENVIFERAKASVWVADDATGTGAKVDANGLTLESSSDGTKAEKQSAKKNFKFTEGSKVTLVTEFKTGTDCGNETSYDFFTFGGLSLNVYRKKNPDNAAFKLSVDGGEEQVLSGTPQSKTYKITFVIDQTTGEASYTINLKDNVIASGTTTTTTALSAVEFGHYYDNIAKSATIFLKSLKITEEPAASTSSSIDLTLNNSYTYSTFCSTKSDVDFTNVKDVEAYQASVNNNVVSLTKVTGKVKAGEGLLIKNVGKVESVSIPTTTGATALVGNKLVGVTKALTATDFADKTAYILASDTEFQLITSATTGTFAVGKAYLDCTAEAGAKPSSLFFGEATGINGVAVEKKADNAIYNLQGMRVKTPTKGLYIINGKKYRF